MNAKYIQEPLYQEIPYLEVNQLFSHIAHEEWAMLLDSANYKQTFQDTNCFSYIVFSPFKTLTVKNGVLLEDNTQINDPFLLLKHYLQSFKMQKIAGLPPFQGGLAGYFAYDLCHYIEKIPFAHMDDMNFPDLAVAFYDIVISFDHVNKKSWVISTGLPEKDNLLRQQRAKERLEEIIMWVQNSAKALPVDKPNNNFAAHISSNFNCEGYINNVSCAKNYIHQGDIFEVNLSQRFKAKLPVHLTPYQLYQRLCHLNPAPFAAYINLGEIVIASASPERFLSLKDGMVVTRPIKGTAPRGQNAEDDRKLGDDLFNSIKDRAENVMIVDLMRNDLSRVCEKDSVEVTTLCGLESYPTVHHLVSVIKGKLKNHMDVIDLLKATLPGGSITGAPKIRAMEIIAELEPNRRGPYCGSIGFISFSGDMDTSIIIRTYAIHRDVVTYQVGGAVVLDSDPMKEYQETLTKGKALRLALLGE